MSSFLILILWCILFVMSWPLAILALLIWPVVWLISLPFRLLGFAFGAVFSFIRELLFLPARILSWRPNSAKYA